MRGVTFRCGDPEAVGYEQRGAERGYLYKSISTQPGFADLRLTGCRRLPISSFCPQLEDLDHMLGALY
jgi:hypothetical protein